ncbi:MAG: diguanylate cyclase [Burkholderiales bacterium]|nr:diguanylate cyclase [Burkholderiales bacterium]
MIRFGLRPIFTVGGAVCGVLGAAGAFALWVSQGHDATPTAYLPRSTIVQGLCAAGLIGGLCGFLVGKKLGRQLADLARRLQHDAGGEPTALPGVRWFFESTLIADAFRAGVHALAARVETAEAQIQSLEAQLVERAERMEAINTQLLHALEERSRLVDKLDQTVLEDEVTGLMNQRWFFVRAELERDRAARHGTPLTVVLMAIDHYKRMIDGYGTVIGHEAIRQVALRIKCTSRTVDTCARFSGEQFALLLAGGDATSARRVADRLRQSLADATIATPDGPVAITASFGIAVWEPGMSLETLVGNAGTALYSAKRAGRDQVELWRA